METEMLPEQSSTETTKTRKNHQRFEHEINFLTKRFEHENHKDEDVYMKDLKTTQREKKTLSPLTLLKEDFNHFNDDHLNDLTKEKDSTKTKQEVSSGLRVIPSEQIEERSDTRKMNSDVKDQINQTENNELVMNVLRGETEPKQNEDLMSNTGIPTCVSFPTGDLGDQKRTESKLGELSQENSKVYLQENNVAHNDDKKDKEDQEDEDMKIKGVVKANHREKRTINPLTLLKEDLLKVFKDTKSQLEDQMSRQTEIKATQFKDVCSSKHNNVKSAGPKTSQTVEKSDNRLSLLTEDFSNMFKISLSKEKDSPVLKAKNTDKPFRNLFRVDQKPLRISAKAEDSEEAKNRLSEMKEEQLDSGCRVNLSEKEEQKKKQNAGKTSDTKDWIDQPDSEPEEKSDTSFSEAQKSEMMSASNTRTPRGFLVNLFGRDQKSLMDSQEVELSEKKGNQLDMDFMGNPKEQNEDNNRNGKRDLDKDTGLDLNVSDEKSVTIFAKTHQTEDLVSTSHVAWLTGFSHPTVSSGDQKPTESKSNVCEEDLTNVSDQQDVKEEDAKAQELLKMNPREKRTTSTLTLLKEDFNNFKDDLLHVFRVGLTKEKDKEEQNEEKLDAEKMSNYMKEKAHEDNSDLVQDVSEEMSEMSFCEDMISMLNKGEDEKKNKQAEDRISLVRLNEDGIENDMRGQPGEDLWSLKNFATYLTFDPNTANSELHLTNSNRKATRVWSDLPSLEHPDRFQRCPQVLCREGLLDCVYWEVKWEGGADIGVAYNSISRDGATSSCLLGHNKRSWSLECSEGSYTPCHNNKRFRSSSPEPFTNTVGVYLDWSAGILSFYCISPETTVHLHTFSATFTEPLYAGFWIWAYEGSVSLHQVKLELDAAVW